MLFFTSDHHFGHANIIKYCNRPYRDVQEMNRALVDNWNDIVEPSDEVWVLGDIAMGNRYETLSYVKELHGYKVLVPGNHDKCWFGHKNFEAHLLDYYDCGFNRIFKSDTTMKLAGEKLLISHFPYLNDDEFGQEGQRYAKYRPANNGGWLLHGHVHDKWRQLNRMINVSVEVWDYFPASAEEIEELIREEKHREMHTTSH